MFYKVLKINKQETPTHQHIGITQEIRSALNPNPSFSCVTLVCNIPSGPCSCMKQLASNQETPPGIISLMDPPKRDILKFPRILCRLSHHLGFVYFQTRPVKDLSALFLEVRVIFPSSKSFSREKRTYLFLKIRQQGHKNAFVLLLGFLFCYEKVILNLPWLHLNPCLDIRVISP